MTLTMYDIASTVAAGFISSCATTWYWLRRIRAMELDRTEALFEGKVLNALSPTWCWCGHTSADHLHGYGPCGGTQTAIGGPALVLEACRCTKFANKNLASKGLRL